MSIQYLGYLLSDLLRMDLEVTYPRNKPVVRGVASVVKTYPVGKYKYPFHTQLVVLASWVSDDLSQLSVITKVKNKLYLFILLEREGSGKYTLTSHVLNAAQVTQEGVALSAATAEGMFEGRPPEESLPLLQPGIVASYTARLKSGKKALQWEESNALHME
jgi:hypothetical protein